MRRIYQSQKFYPLSPFFVLPHHSEGGKFVHPRREFVGGGVSRHVCRELCGGVGDHG